MSGVNSFYQADLVFDGLDGEMTGKEVLAVNFTELIKEIEKIKNEHIKVEVWSALFVYGRETSQIKMKLIENLKSREKGRKNGQ